MLFTGHYFDNYKLDDVTELSIENAQQKLKVTLPDSYVRLMQQQNGGELYAKRLDVGDEVLSIDYLNGIGENTGEGILLSSTLKREWGLSNRFVYLYGDGHTWVALDYRRYKGNNPPVTYIDLEQNRKEIIAQDFETFLTYLKYDESLQSSAHEYGRELEFFPREEVESVMESCNGAYKMSAGMEYYGFTDENLTWYFTQLHDYVKAFAVEGYSPYDKPDRTFGMLDFFLNCTIAIIRKRKVYLTDYSVAMQLLERLAAFPSAYDDDGMIKRKAKKIQAYFGV